MKTNVTFSDFIDSFRSGGRENSFTYDGFKALYNYLIEFEESTDSELELDPIAFDCDFTEYEDIEEFHQNYEKEDYPTIEDIENNTFVIKVSEESFIIQNF